MVNPINGIFLALVTLCPLIACPSITWAQSEQDKGDAKDSVSFVKTVAPIITAKCGKCHVASSKGDYQIESYTALLASETITPNDPNDSGFIEVIESGEMPKGGLKVSDSELKTLKDWIAQGAKFDGDVAEKALMKPSEGQGGAGSRQGGRSSGGPNRLKAVEQNPQAVGDSGVAWYSTWESGLAEAKRSNRPIFFMSAAAQCSGVSGVF